MMTRVIYRIDGTENFGFILYQDGKAVQRQRITPCIGGNMTEAQATAIADYIVIRANERKSPAEEAECVAILDKAKNLRCSRCGTAIEVPEKLGSPDSPTLSENQRSRLKQLLAKGDASLTAEKVNEILRGIIP
jgi:hypothetical protein